MTARAYIATVTVNGQAFVSTIPLSDDDYLEFMNGEFNAQQGVLTMLRQNETYQGINLDPSQIRITPEF